MCLNKRTNLSHTLTRNHLLSPGLENNGTFKCIYDRFQTSWLIEKNCWKFTLKCSCSPIQRTKSKLVLKCHVARIWECDLRAVPELVWHGLNCKIMKKVPIKTQKYEKLFFSKKIKTFIHDTLNQFKWPYINGHVIFSLKKKNTFYFVHWVYTLLNFGLKHHLLNN